MLDINQYDVFVFDLDGTLVDSVPDLTLALNHALNTLNFIPVGESNVRQWVGNGSLKLIERALDFIAECTSNNIKKLHSQFLVSYQNTLCEKSVLYPKVKPTLELLKESEKTLVLLTNKPIQFVPELLEKLGISDFFSLVLGGDSLQSKKPDPLPLLHVMKECSTQADKCLMIGDSRADIECAQQAGVACVALQQGYNQGLDLSVLSPSYLFEDMGQLFSQLRS
ncbi:phosphoglycolate phosphatase [Oceaniserpentilla sp. 4NH20-0058]|uniref:phosphoglycolate phosphatase n=1 Tax=Oceaniserpentilla sp. 4NH20-0058 TaxID=3127660 RepID=UPI003104FC88